MSRVLFTASLALIASLGWAPRALAQSGPNQPGTQDAAYLVEQYDYFELRDKKVYRVALRMPAIIITVRDWMKVTDVLSNGAITLIDKRSGAAALPFEVLELGSEDVPTDEAGVQAYGWFLIVPAKGVTLDPQGEYEVVLHYDAVATWHWETDANGDKVPSRAPGPMAAKTLTVEALPKDKHVTADGRLVAPNPYDPTNYEAPGDDLFSMTLGERWDTQLLPQVAEDSSEFGLSYTSTFKLYQEGELASMPGSLGVDFAFDGRWSSDRQNQGLTDYMNAELNARWMGLPELGGRYFPMGLRLAAGYEDGDQATDAGATATVDLIFTIPWVGDLALQWQEAWGFQRVFAPPYASLRYVSSAAEVAGMDQSRMVAELGWIIPIAEEWDVNLQWERNFFDEDAIGDQSLFTGDLTYYANGDLTQGVRMSFESGYRAAVGDIDSTVLLGYLIKL